MAVSRHISVILPLKLEWEPFYLLPDGVEVEVGDRVYAPFAGHTYLAVVSAVGVTPDDKALSRIKEIFGPAPSKQKIAASEMAFWRLLAGYYMTTVGEVYKSAYPPSKDETVTSRLKEEDIPTLPAADLSGAVADTIERVETEFGRPGSLLLSCDDTEEVLSQLCLRHLDRNILWLVPQTRFSRDMQQRLSRVFGSRLMLWDTKQSAARKRLALNHMRDDKPYIVLGTRSSVFLPHRNLGLVIVQDEHDAAYRQDSTLRYNGRDAAALLASVFGAKVVLESPVPSLDSLYNCFTGKYIGVNTMLPRKLEFEIVDTRAEMRKNGMRGELSVKLLEHAGERIAAYKPSRSMFPRTEELRPQLEAAFGERCFYTEDLVADPLPDDTQTMAIFGLDSVLGHPGFKADEQCLHTVAKAVQGAPSGLETVVIQTSRSSHPVFTAICTGDLSPLLQERRNFSYPPFSRIVDILVRDTNDKRRGYMMDFLKRDVQALGFDTIVADFGLRVMLPRDKALVSNKLRLSGTIAHFEIQHRYKSHIIFDVDPAE